VKIKLHFNRINMQRKDKRVWSAHTSKSCNMSEVVEIRYKGRLVATTVFNPAKPQNPRAWIELQGTVSYREDTTVIEVE